MLIVIQIKRLYFKNHYLKLGKKIVFDSDKNQMHLLEQTKLIKFYNITYYLPAHKHVFHC